MKSILNHKTHLTAKVSLLAIILLVSIAMPLLTFTASAAGTVSISPSSGPNGTAVKVTGSGFGVSENASASGTFTVAIDGLLTKASLTPTGLAGSGYLATSSTGALSGYFIIGGAGSLNLLPGAHTIQISDSTASPPAVSFTIVAPTVTLTPSTGPAGTSVTVAAKGFPVSVGTSPVVWSLPGEVAVAASFAGSTIPVASGFFTNTPTTLSGNFIFSGTLTETVSLPAIVTGAAFNLTDAYGNSAITNFALTTPTVTLSPASGPVGTLVTATATGFGPGASFASVKIGNGVAPTTISPLIPATPMVTEQGTSAFQFNVTKSPLTADFAAGTQMITVKDSLGNVASAAFTITPQAIVTLGSATVNSGVAYAPAGATGVAAWLSVTGFKASSLLTITSSPGVPAAWITFNGGYYPAVVTDTTGSIVTPIASMTGTAPPSGVYSITISDGTNTVTLLLTLTSSGNFFVISPISGAQGTTVTLTGFLTTPATTSAINFDGFAVSGATQCAANTWPTPPTTMGIFTVPSSGAGPHTITATGISGSATFTNTGAPAITMVSPSSAAVGTTVTIVGMGFANNLAQTSFPSFTIDSITVPVTVTAFTQGAMIATFVVPVFLPGTHIISATDGYFNTATASLTTTVSSITVSPTKGVIATSAGTMLTLTGSNFPMNQLITATFTGISGNLPGYFGGVGLTSTNTNGGILLDWLSIPNTQTVAGAHTITVTAGSASATATFTVVSTISLTATAVKPGGTTSITGAGFAASSALSLLINSAAASWYNTAVTPATVLTTAPSTSTIGSLPTGIGTVIASTADPGKYNITVVDAAGNAASTTLTVLGAPAITLAAAQGISGVGTVGIAGTGFTPGSRTASVDIYQGSTLVASAVQTATNPITVAADGTFKNTVEGFNVPTGVAGVYTVNLTLTLPTESAIAAFTILGAPTVTTSVASATAGTNVTVTVVGITAVTTAHLGSTDLLAQGANTFGSTTVLATGANAYNLTTWFIVPAITASPYTILFGDGVRSAFTTFTVVPSISLSPATGILKGTFVYITGTGFAASGTAFNVTVNGALITAAAGTTGSGGSVSTNFVVPLTAVLNNTVVVTDTTGNAATSYFALTPPTIALTPTSGPVGSTVQIIGNAFTPNSAIIVEVGATIVNTVPATATPNGAGAFIAYVTIPAGLAGNQTITVIDSSNNVATAIFTVAGTTVGFTIDQTALSTTAQTVNSAGQPATSFARGSTVKITFVLDSTSGSGNVVWRVTLQQGTAVYNIATTSASVSTTPTTLSFSQLIPSTVSPGTWTASIQIFASDGVTPLGVATLVFNVT